MLSRPLAVCRRCMAPKLGRGKRFKQQRVSGWLARLALSDGTAGLVVAPRGRLFRVLRFTFAGGRIAALDVIGDPERLQATEVGILGE